MISTPTYPLLINSLPKSGTHLVAKLAELAGYIEHAQCRSYKPGTPSFLNYRQARACLKKAANRQGVHAATHSISVGTLTETPVPVDVLSDWLGAVSPGHFILGHIPWHPLISPLVNNHGIKHIVIIRDPRAVLVSLLDFILNTRGMQDKHFLETDFRNLTPNQRLEFLLNGGRAQREGVTVFPFLHVYRSMFRWKQDPDSLFIRFEDLIGPKGGGCEERQRRTTTEILDFLELPSSPPDRLINGIYDRSARTFREGQVDGWRRTLSAEEAQRIERYCSPLCQQAGYVSVA